MANKSFIYAANEHYAIVRCSDVPSERYVSKDKHPEIVATASFLSINNWRRLFEFIERYSFAYNMVPLFYKPYTIDELAKLQMGPDIEEALARSFDKIKPRLKRDYDNDDASHYIRREIIMSCDTPSTYWMGNYNSMGLERYLGSIGINYLDEDFADHFFMECDDNNEDFLMLNIDELMSLRDELGALVMAASIALGSEKSFDAWGKLHSDNPRIDYNFALDYLYRAKASGHLDDVSDYDLKKYGFEQQGRTGYELVVAAAITYAIDSLNTWRYFSEDSFLREKVLNHTFSDSKVDYHPLNLHRTKFRFFDGGFMEVPDRHAHTFADLFALEVTVAVQEGKVFTCSECGSPCISVKSFDNSENKYCSASCKTNSSKKNK